MKGKQTRVSTVARKALFLKSLGLTGGNISRACSLASISRTTISNYRLKESPAYDPVFRQQCDETLEAAIESLEEEARRRAFKGVAEPVFHQGKKIGTTQKYSDVLLIFLLKAHKPKMYRDNAKVSLDELDAEITRRLAAMAPGREEEITGAVASDSVN